MYKRLLKKVRYLKFLENHPKFKLGSLLVAVICAFLIIIATFTQLQLGYLSIPDGAFSNPAQFFSGIKSFDDILRVYFYIPQIPAILFTAALLGPGIGMISVILYILAGLIGFPVFASGGGIDYYNDVGFGYILGYIVAVFIVGNILSAKVTSFSIIRATIIGVFAIHFVGIVYLTVLMLLQHSSIFSIFGWIWAKSGMQLPYDLFVGFLALSLARPVRAILWVAMD